MMLTTAVAKNLVSESKSRRMDALPASFFSSSKLWCFIIGDYVQVPMDIFLWMAKLTLQQPAMNSVWSGRKLIIVN
jgi:hypothetical protein